MNAAPQADERLRAFHARSLQYLRLGYDREAAARSVIDAAGPLRGPALDVGTGKGLCAVALAQIGLCVLSVDLNGDEQRLALLVAGEAGVAGRVGFVRGDAAHLPCPDACFGSVAMMDVLHHIDAAGPVLREIARVLEDGGVLVVADFDERGFDLVARVHDSDGVVHPRTAVTVDTIAQELRGCGFERIRRAGGCLHDILVLARRPRLSD